MRKHGIAPRWRAAPLLLAMLGALIHAGPAQAVTLPAGFAEKTVFTGLTQPTAVRFAPDGRVFVAEKRGVIKEFDSLSDTTARIVADLSTNVHDYWDRGLLSIAIDPSFPTKNVIYALYSFDAPIGGTAPVYNDACADPTGVGCKIGGRLSRIVLDGTGTGTGSEQVMIEDWCQQYPSHSTGGLAFGPDGKLYAGTGDAGDTSLAQDPSSPNGKILRLEPDGSVPDDNPRDGSPVLSLGHRNVQGLAWDDRDRLWATEFGQNTFDEINQIRPGRNYGWPEVEGDGTGGGRFVAPEVTWPTSEASPSGVAYADGALYVGALRGQRIWRVPLDGRSAGRPEALLDGEYGRLRSVAAVPGGDALWATTSNRDGRGDPAEDDDRIIRLEP